MGRELLRDSRFAGIRTNMGTNPSFEAAGGGAEQRRNFVSNPLPASLTGYTRAGAAASTLTYETTGGPAASGGAWIKNTMTNPAPATDVQIQVPQVVSPSLRGISAWVFSSKAGNYVFRAWTYDAGGTYLTTTNDITTATFALAANTWTLVTLPTSIPPVAYARFIAFLRPNGPTMNSGDVFGVALWTSSDSVGPPFTGASSYDSDLVASWVGAANLTMSILTGTTVASTPGGWQSSQWSIHGTKSVRVIPATHSTDTRASPGGDLGAMRLGMVAGGTYTASATIRMTAAQTGSLNSLARRMVAYWRTTSGGSTYFTAQSDAAANAAGVTRLSLTFTLPADTTEAFVRLFNGALTGNGEVWWDNFLLEAGTTLGIYFDGSYPNARWASTANASASLGYGFVGLI